MPIKVLLFDLDDTLIPSTRIYRKALKAVGISDKSAAYLKAREAVKKELGSNHPRSHDRLLYFKAMGRKDAGRLIAKYEKILGRECAAAWKKSKRPALFKRLARQYTLAIVTNENTRTQRVKLRAIDPQRRFFKAMVTSEQVGVEKPDLKIFRAALRRIKKKPAECAMVGDSVSADIRPMKRLGGKALFVKNTNLNSLERWLDENR